MLAHLADIYQCPTDRWEVVAHHVIPDAVPATPPPLRLTRPVEVGDGLLVCGDHRDTASIQGALVSGQRAARVLAAGAVVEGFGRFEGDERTPRRSRPRRPPWTS